jgi:hypothetical protein
LCLQKCREEICCQPLEAFAIKTSCIAQSLPGASSLDIKVKILATTRFVFYITKKKIPQNQRKEQCRELISTQGKKKKKEPNLRSVRLAQESENQICYKKWVKN